MKKEKVMKNTTTHHEIVLLTGTSLTNRQLSDRSESNGKSNSAIEELEKACWNGILYEMFPEIIGSFHIRCENFLWHILAGKYFLYINIGPNPVSTEHSTSIDPYFAMMNTCEN